MHETLLVLFFALFSSFFLLFLYPPFFFLFFFSFLFTNKSQTRKVDVVKKKGIKFVLRERSTLIFLNHPFIIKLCGSFMDRANLYLVLEYESQGMAKASRM